VIIYLHTLSAIIGLTINVICQVCICRYINRKFSLLKSVYTGFVLGLCGLILTELYYLYQSPLPLREKICFILVNVITYSALGYGYFHFINLGETARRIRILRELYNSQNGLSLEGILTKYNAQKILSRRMNRLLNNNQVVCRNGRYYINNPTMLIMAKIIVAMKLIVLGKKSEFN